jgi:hypothetical protein
MEAIETQVGHLLPEGVSKSARSAWPGKFVARSVPRCIGIARWANECVTRFDLASWMEAHRKSVNPIGRCNVGASSLSHEFDSRLTDGACSKTSTFLENEKWDTHLHNFTF